MFKIISVFKFIQFPDQLVDSAIQGDIQHVITSNLDEVNNATITYLAVFILVFTV
jgi:hypothetical protein